MEENGENEEEEGFENRVSSLTPSSVKFLEGTCSISCYLSAFHIIA